MLPQAGPESEIQEYYYLSYKELVAAKLHSWNRFSDDLPLLCACVAAAL